VTEEITSICADFVVDDAVSPNRSRGGNSLVTGKKQGKSSKIGLERQNLLPIVAVLSVICTENSPRRLTGNSFVANGESFLRNSDRSGAFSESAVKRTHQWVTARTQASLSSASVSFASKTSKVIA
jgi:hypothetical protein